MMKGIRYVVDDHGEKKAVLIDLQENRELWEDFCDTALAAERAAEPRESLADVKRQILNR
ncbi:MAG: hypothetical protein GXP24_09005 [Planctomycetes bacterium]|nr:hypothetical protein [Planctomycetota bacterium]